jgi:hypothetical protein
VLGPLRLPAGAAVYPGMRTFTLLVTAAVTMPGCIFGGIGSGATTPDMAEQPRAPLETHVRLFRKNLPERYGLGLGRLPADLSVPDLADQRFDVGAHATPTTMAPISGLGFAGVEGDRICFTDGEQLGEYDSTSQTDLLAAKQRQIATDGVWVMAVPSLSALAGPAWPAPAEAVRLTTAVVSGDRVSTYSDREKYGDGYIDVKKTKRFVHYDLCGTGFQAAADSRYLIAVAHNERTPDEYERTPLSDDDQDAKDEIAAQHDALMVWTISADGSSDVSK